MMDVGQYYNGTKTIDVIETTTPSATAYGETAIYAVKLGLNAFHGISVDGSKMVHTYLPDLNAPGAVKKGEVEMLDNKTIAGYNRVRGWVARYFYYMIVFDRPYTVKKELPQELM